MTRVAFSRLRGDERGASVIELALTAPILAALLMGMTDVARAYTMKLTVEQAAQRTIERVENQKSVATSYDATLSAEALSAMTDAGYPTGNTITPESWRECGTSTTHESFTGECANPSDAVARYVSVRISRKYVPMFKSRRWPGANADGTITVSGFAQVRVQ